MLLESWEIQELNPEVTLPLFSRRSALAWDTPHPGCQARPKQRWLFPDFGFLHMLFSLSGRFFPFGPHMAAHSHSSCLCLNVTTAEVFL